MNIRILILFSLVVTLLNGTNLEKSTHSNVSDNNQSNSNISKPKYTTFINIVSNVKNTNIYLNGNLIGQTPIKQHPVIPYQDIKLMAKANKDYYEKDLMGMIRVRKHTVQTYSLKFKKAKTKIFLIGEDGDLYINGKFVKALRATNRVVEVEAGKEVKIKVVNKKNDYFETTQDLVSNTITDIPYKIVPIHKEIKLLTTTIDNYMWEDTKEAATKPINWKNAKKYCKNLKLGNLTDWYMPTIEQLDDLYENRDKIYHGFGGAFYWSSSIFSDEKFIWGYSYVKDFNEGETKKSVKEFEQARIRCVRDIETEIIE
jgi:hypothetical protein